MLELLLRGRLGDVAAERLLDAAETLHAPHLLDLEVTQVLRRYVRAREISAARGREALGDYLDLRIDRHPTEPLLARIWELRDKATAYDAAYLALAEALDAPLITADVRLSAASGHTAQVDVLQGR